ncbi:ABC transporter ATP-binding protein [Aquabacterium sp. A7-Y]|uniref:ABC transporter ATP-binding protein n=1 Tax=Aquabacterium sp. A7-Y TaxID=1349605 RepID=UPI0039FC7720
MPTPHALALHMEDVSCEFPSNHRDGTTYCAVDRASLDVRDGEFVSIVGPTGCGKSTLLNVAAGLLTPTSGRVGVFGEPLHGTNAKAGYMFQGESLLPWKTALENVMLGLVCRKEEPRRAAQISRSWLARVGLQGFEDRYPHQLSGGMRKRVALAQMLALSPRIILMDEPFSALDVQTRQLMENELLDIWAGERCSVLFVTHDLEEAIAMSDRVVVLSAGPGTRPIAEFDIPLARPRDVNEIRLRPEFQRLHAEIWDAMKSEVLKGYEQTRRAA